MYVSNIKAAPSERGGRIDLSWENPSKEDFPNFKGVKMVRRERRFPETTPPRYASDIGDYIYDGILVRNVTDGKESFPDTGLKGETVYYYTFYTYDDNPDPAKIQHFANRSSRVSAMATSTYAIGDELYQLIPAIYKRYDAREELKSFLGIFGHQLDLIRSFISATRAFKDLDECDGALLPLLAQWIGWQTNLSLDLDAQRNEVRNAPELYKTVGTIPNLRALVNRLTGWDCRIKELVHNVFLTNTAEPIQLWEVYGRRSGPSWANIIKITHTDDFDGRPVAALSNTGDIWLFWHRGFNGRREIHLENFGNQNPVPYKAVLTDLAADEPSVYTDENPSVVADADRVWLFWDSNRDGTWNIWGAWDTWEEPFKNYPEEGVINVSEYNADDRFPAVIIDGGGNIRVFWQSNRRGTSDIWMRVYEQQADGSYAWLDPECIAKADILYERPVAVIDNTGRIWVFFNAALGDRINIYAMIYDGNKWSDPRPVTSGPYRDEAPSAVLWDDEVRLFWHSNRDGHWQIWETFHDDSEWGEPVKLTFEATADKEPSAIVNPQNDLFLFWRSQRRGRKYQSRTIDFDDSEMLARLGKFEDRAHYSYDTAKANDDWYARDTIAIHLNPATDEKDVIEKKLNLLKNSLKRFLPIHVRPVYIIESERVVLRTVEIDETVQPPVVRYADHSTVDLTVTPPLKKYRTWSIIN